MIQPLSICANCKFYKSDDSTCHLSPPVQEKVSTDYTHEQVWRWPSVASADWCGEWSRA